MTKSQSALYKEAGVDIDLAGELLNRVKPKIAAARRPEMLAPIGGFGGLFQMDLSKYVSSTFLKFLQTSLSGNSLISKCNSKVTPFLEKAQ